MFVVVAWLCGSACDVYQRKSLQNEQQNAQPATAEPAPRGQLAFDFIDFRSALPRINPRQNDAGAPSTQPPKARKTADPPVAGTQAPSENRDPELDRNPREALESADDAGVASAIDAGALDVDAGMPQRIETGRPHEVDAGMPREVDAGGSRPVAKASAACRGERGFETDGRCYFVLEEKVSWNVGRDHCYEHDAHLASVTTERESDLIASFDLELDVWIGFSRFGAAYFSWLSNESGSYTNWQKGAPRPMQESGALILASTGLWTNRAVPELHAVLCETERKASRRSSKNFADPAQ